MTQDNSVMSAAFKYDVFGNMVEEDVVQGSTSTTSRYAYDDWNPAKANATGNAGHAVWAVMNSGNTLTARYMDGDGVDQHFIMMKVSGTTYTPYYYLTDQQGSIRDVVNLSGSILDAVRYDPYGNITLETNATYRGLYAWDGYFWDASSQLYIVDGREYGPSTARWQQQDPTGLGPDVNPYRYALNMPTVKVDPSGLDSIDIDSFSNGRPTGFVSWRFDDGSYLNIGTWKQGIDYPRVVLSSTYGGREEQLSWLQRGLREGVSFSDVPSGKRASVVKLYLQAFLDPTNQADIENGRFYGMFNNNTAAGALGQEFPATLARLGTSVATDLAIQFAIAPGMQKVLPLVFRQIGKATGKAYNFIEGKLFKKVGARIVAATEAEASDVLRRLNASLGSGTAAIREVAGPGGFDAAGRLVRNGTRSVQAQIANNTCGPTCVGMVLDTINAGRTSTNVINLGLTRSGTTLDRLAVLLRRNGVTTATWRTGYGIRDIAEATAGGNPLIAAVRTSTGGHAVVVDGVATRLGQRVVAIRDPDAGRQYFELASVFLSRFTGQVVAIH